MSSAGDLIADLTNRLAAVEQRLNFLELPPERRLVLKIDAAIRNLPSGVVRVGYSFGEDHTGDPAIFFRVLLGDLPAGQIKVLAGNVSRRLKEIDLQGRFAYYRFRTESEQKELNDPEWAAEVPENPLDSRLDRG